MILEAYGGRAGNIERAEALSIALDGFSEEDIQRGLRAVLRGDIPDFDPAFPPSTGQVVKACRKKTFLSPGWVPVYGVTGGK